MDPNNRLLDSRSPLAMSPVGRLRGTTVRQEALASRTEPPSTGANDERLTQLARDLAEVRSQVTAIKLFVSAIPGAADAPRSTIMHALRDQVRDLAAAAQTVDDMHFIASCLAAARKSGCD